MADDKPIIIIKKKGGHGGHHGGAWKVAYADFVTAMMAFFMVMWLINTSSTPVKQAIASYFRKPGIFESGSGTPLLIGESGILQDGYVPPHPEDTSQAYPGKSKEILLQKSGNDSKTTGNKRITYKGTEGKKDSVEDDDAAQRGFQTKEEDDPSLAKNIAIHKLKDNQDARSDGDTVTKEVQKSQMEGVAAQIRQQLGNSPDLKNLSNMANIKVDADGLKIEFMDSDKGSMFQSGSTLMSPDATKAFETIAPILAKLPNTIDIEGHTDGQALTLRPGSYSNWELSSDRANAARRALEKFGIPATQIGSVVGRADKDLKVPADPSSPANRRVTVRVKFNSANLTTGEKKDSSAAAASSASALSAAQQPASSASQAPTSASTEADSSAPPPSSSESSKSEISSTESKAASSPNFDAADEEPDKPRRDGRIKLPNTGVPVENPPPTRKTDKIFGETPVIGPRDPFSNIN